MKAAINYQITGKKVFVFLPFEFNSSFKLTFKTAQISSRFSFKGKQCWEVNNNTRNINKLDQWIEKEKAQVTQTKEDKLTDEEIEQLEQLESKLTTVTDKINDLSWSAKMASDRTNRLEEIKGLLIEKQAQLKAQQAIADEIEQKEKEKQTEIMQFINRTINLSEVHSIHTEMKNVERALLHGHNKRAKHVFETCQHKLEKVKTQLAEVGIMSVGLNELCAANANRIDRDAPSFISTADIESFFKLSTQSH